MKFLPTIVASLTLAVPSLACLRIKGGITRNPFPNLSGIWNVEAIDNGVTVCSGGARIDQDGHYSM